MDPFDIKTGRPLPPPPPPPQPKPDTLSQSTIFKAESLVDELKREIPNKVDPELVELTREQRDMLGCRVEFNKGSGRLLETLLAELVATTKKQRAHVPTYENKQNWWWSW